MQAIPKSELCLFVRYGNHKIWWPKIRYTSVKTKDDIIRCVSRYYQHSYDRVTDCVTFLPTQCSYCVVHYDLSERQWYVDGVLTAMPLSRKCLAARFEITRQQETLQFPAVSPEDQAPDSGPDTVAELDFLQTTSPVQGWYAHLIASTPKAHLHCGKTPLTTDKHHPGTPDSEEIGCPGYDGKSLGAWSN